MGNPTSKLSKKALKNVRSQTLFTNEEIKGWYNGFIRDCPTGKLTWPEFLNIYGKCFPNGDPEDFARVVFNCCDANGDGFIQFDEFLIPLSITSRGRLQDKLESCHDIVLDSKCLTNLEGDIGNIISKYFKLKLHVGAFKLYDTNRDGAITKEEMLNMIKSMVSMMGNKIKHDDLTAEKRVENIFNHMDKDNDGELTKEEFILGAAQDSTIITALTILTILGMSALKHVSC